ncbi:MAG TPA: bifunctional diaminohydroxyphosphoribosylaminopyrimidine deaminase/5-amino-6-(5-phosphoribosylamino)uracil reductase RibD [Nitrospirae bacterium]|nr:bifunctional diaminohydroxyphosphoribosylaminopyrimidine deaminase/5-amino-6-(5-phosphoribosylamino)uracil reductase RibD [Nitrospirota bacterium]
MMNDAKYMKRALLLASRARGRTSPNPMVGAVIVKGGKVIAEAYHKKAGSPHAEVLALALAGKYAYGATLYVTLEPCCHTKKRTPPCTGAIIDAGIERVLIAMEDPNPSVAGKGVSQLMRAGLDVECCVLGAEAARLNEAYIKYITTDMPFVTLKAALTLDGKIATPTGESKWISGEKSRELAHRMRAESDAIITAIGTVKADDPQLTARGKGPLFRDRGGRNGPVRVVIDPRLEVPIGSKILDGLPETVIVTSKDVTAKKSGKAQKLIKSGIKIINYKGKLKLKWLLKKLGSMGVMSAMIEGGSSLNWHALDEGVVDKVSFFVAPKVIGGRKSISVVGGESFRSLGRAIKFREMKARNVGEDLLITGYLV